MKSAKFLSPAKVNLFLRVLFLRSDGYHELASLFQAIDIFDTLEIQIANEDCFTTNFEKLYFDPFNLVLKALNLFRQKSKLSFKVKIHLDKKIPVQAGLGGGSSNAATTLWALNELTGKKFNSQTLQKWGSELGSDVPFFFSTGRAYCHGRGEMVESLAPQEMSGFIAVPPFGTSTAQVYANCCVKELIQVDPYYIYKSHFTSTPYLVNDLEGGAFIVTPALLELKKQLGIERSVLTGSGSSFLILGDEEPPKIENIKVYKVKGIHRNEENWYSR